MSRDAMPPAESRERFVSAMRGAIRGDFLIRVILVALVAHPLIYLLLDLPEQQAAANSRTYSVFFFVVLVLVALLKDSSQVEAEERPFWTNITAAYSCWTVVAALLLVFPESDASLVPHLTTTALFSLHYLAMVLAVEKHPHRQSPWRPEGLERNLTWPAVAFFVLGLLIYFVVIPMLEDSAEHADRASQLFLFLTLSVYLTGKLIYLGSTAGNRRWRVLYWFLAASTGSSLISLTLEILFIVQPGWSWHWPLSAVYSLQFVAVALAARLRHRAWLDPPETAPVDDQPEDHLPRPVLRTMTYALAFPLIHYGLYRFGVLGRASFETREFLVAVWILLLGAAALVQSHFLVQHVRELWRKRAALGESEQDLRLMVERMHAEEQLRTSEEKLSKVFQVFPDVTVISSLTDGRLLEVNESFEQLFGYRRREVVGRSVREVDLWADRGARDAMVEELQREGSIHDLEVEMRAKSGEPLRLLLSAERIELDGEPCIISVAHQIPAPEAPAQRWSGLLERLETAAFVLDPKERVTTWSPGAEGLLGWTAEEARGRPCRQLLGLDSTDLPSAARRELGEAGAWSGPLSLATRRGGELLVDSWWTRLDLPSGTGCMVCAAPRPEEPSASL